MWRFRRKYAPYTKGIKFLTIFNALQVVANQTIYLLTTDLTTRQLIGISRDSIEEVYRGPQTTPKVLARRSNAM